MIAHRTAWTALILSTWATAPGCDPESFETDETYEQDQDELKGKGKRKPRGSSSSSAATTSAASSTAGTTSGAGGQSSTSSSVASTTGSSASGGPSQNCDPSEGADIVSSKDELTGYDIRAQAFALSLTAIASPSPAMTIVSTNEVEIHCGRYYAATVRWGFDATKEIWVSPTRNHLYVAHAQPGLVYGPLHLTSPFSGTLYSTIGMTRLTELAELP